jgi:hypothetical protein
MGSVRDAELREELRKTFDPAPWGLLKLHAQRDGLIWVSPGLSLLDVAVAMATDDVKVVEAWLTQGLVRRPSPSEIASWDLTPQREFLSVVVQPWALFQELSA